MNSPSQRYLAWSAAGLAFGGYIASVFFLGLLPRVPERELMRIAIPPPIQVVLAGGDRYLAANLAVFRAQVAGTSEMDPDSFVTLAAVQTGAAMLNPAHEDNYYIAQAILPWNGHVAEDIIIQRAATAARPADPMPPFFLGFDQYYFLRDPIAGARSVQMAAERSPENNRKYLTAVAARWYEKGDDPRTAVGIIEAMAKNTRDRDLQKLLEARTTRLQGLALLRDSAKTFTERYGRSPKSLDELIGPGLLASLPKDPLGHGYTLDSNGVPILARSVSAK